MYSQEKLFFHYNFQPEANLKTALLYQNKKVINLVVETNVFTVRPLEPGHSEQS